MRNSKGRVGNGNGKLNCVLPALGSLDLADYVDCNYIILDSGILGLLGNKRPSFVLPRDL